MDVKPVEAPICIGCQNEPAIQFFLFTPERGLPFGKLCLVELHSHFFAEYDVPDTAPITHKQYVIHTSHVGERRHDHGARCGICEQAEPGWRWWTTEHRNVEIS